MMEEEIIDTNLLIAKFMGYKYNAGYKRYELKIDSGVINSFGTPLVITDIPYHASWDWLMPVVKKITEVSSPGYYFYISANTLDYRCFITGKLSNKRLAESDNDASGKNRNATLLDIVYQTVTQFITQYNSQSHKTE